MVNNTTDTNYEYNIYHTPPSQTQQRVISSLQIPPSVLSLIGSSLIIYNIRKSNKRTPNRRIMLALSVCNIISTMGLILEPFLVPSDASPEPWVFAVGNDASCVMLGAISQFSIISQPMYLAFLSLYFLLAVKFGIRQRDFEVKYERWVHGFILVFAISTALGGIFLGYFRPNVVSPGCWPNVVSPGCWVNAPIAEGCEGGCRERSFAIIFGAVPSIMSLLAIVISNGMLYAHVRRTVVEGQRKTMSNERKLGDFSSSMESGDFQLAMAVVRSQASDSTSDHTGSEKNWRDDLVDKSRKYAMFHSSSVRSMSPFKHSTGSVLRSSDKQWKRVRKVGHQALLYVGAFLLTFSWSYAIHYLNSQGSGAVPFPLVVLQATFLPALGVLNAMIFILPKYRSSRRKYDCEPWWWVLEQVLTGEVEKVERFSSIISNVSTFNGGMRSDPQRRESTTRKTKQRLEQKKAKSSRQQVPHAISMKSGENSDDLSSDDMGLVDEESIH